MTSKALERRKSYVDIIKEAAESGQRAVSETGELYATQHLLQKIIIQD